MLNYDRIYEYPNLFSNINTYTDLITWCTFKVIGEGSILDIMIVKDIRLNVKPTYRLNPFINYPIKVNIPRSLQFYSGDLILYIPRERSRLPLVNTRIRICRFIRPYIISPFTVRKLFINHPFTFATLGSLNVVRDIVIRQENHHVYYFTTSNYNLLRTHIIFVRPANGAQSRLFHTVYYAPDAGSWFNMEPDFLFNRGGYTKLARRYNYVTFTFNRPSMYAIHIPVSEKLPNASSINMMLLANELHLKVQPASQWYGATPLYINEMDYSFCNHTAKHITHKWRRLFGPKWHWLYHHADCEWFYHLNLDPTHKIKVRSTVTDSIFMGMGNLAV